MSSFNGFNFLLPGSYSMTRQFAADTSGAFVVENFRAADWFGSCPQLSAQLQAAAVARGEVRAITVDVTAGTLDIAQEADPDLGSGNRFARAANGSNVETFTLRFPNALGLFQVWLRAAGASGQITVWFDIPSAAQV